jgi:ABC-2 type transport system permease protein
MLRWLSNVLHLGLKEFASLASDKVLAIFIVYSFSISIYSIATGVKTEVSNAPVAIVDSDQSILSGRLHDGFLGPYFQRPVGVDRSEVDRLMDRGLYTFVLDVPPRFESDILRGRVPALQLNIDATAMTQAGVGASYIQAIVDQETRNYLKSRGIEAQLPIVTVTRAFFNPNLEGVWFHSVMAVIENVTILSILLVGAAVIRERERGTIEHLLVMPIQPSEIAVSKIWANGLVILIAAGLSLTFVVQQVLHVPIEGSIALFLCGTAVYLFATTSLGILLATIANTMPQFALLAIPVFLILNMLSGAVSPLESMPAFLQVTVQISPAVHYVKFAQAVLYRGAGFAVVWLHLVILTLLGGAFLAVALARFRTMLARTS